MTYRFVSPRLGKAALSRTVPPWTLKPAVPVAAGLDAATCKALAEIVIAAHEAGQGWPSRTRYAASTEWNVNNSFRSSKNLPPALAGLSSAYDALQAYAFSALGDFGLDSRQHELKIVDEQCLVYQTGDHIGDHADDSALMPGDEAEADAEVEWQVIKPERHFVGILWLTSQTAEGAGRHEFAGGTFRFNSLVHQATGEPMDIRPTAGSMIFFPANPWFRHEVLTVLAGTRIALTRWWQVAPASTAS